MFSEDLLYKSTGDIPCVILYKVLRKHGPHILCNIIITVVAQHRKMSINYTIFTLKYDISHAPTYDIAVRSSLFYYTYQVAFKHMPI